MDTATELSAAEVVERVLAARATEQAAAVEQLELALVWARLHPCAENEVPAHWGEVDLHSEGPSPLAGPGAPLVAEFAPADLGAALGISLDAARLLLGDALELAHRLPRLWDLVRTGRVPAWRARQISRQTHDLSVEAAAFADRLIAATPDQIGRVDAARLVDEARLYFDPDRAVEDEQHALSSRGVWLRPGRSGPATTEVFMVLDTPDAELFDATVTRIAGDLRALGDTEALEVRRARAVGILADPQHALDLMSGRDGAAPSPGAGTLDLYVHLTPRGPRARHRGTHHRGGDDREARRGHHRPARHLAGPPHRCRLQGRLAAGARPRRQRRGRPARPTAGHARPGRSPRQPLRLPRLPPRLPVLRLS